jgi:hypothetical protein
MTICEREIWTAANEVIKGYEYPRLHAAERYDVLLDQGDMEGCRVWRRISAAIEELLNIKPEAKFIEPHEHELPSHIHHAGLAHLCFERPCRRVHLQRREHN